MAVLESWQRLTRVLPNKPFGDGADGVFSSATIPTMTYRSCSGAASQADLTIASGAYSNGDVVLIHQTRGTGVGQWEINRISSGGGTTTLTMQEDLNYTYTDSGASQAQVVKILRYTDVTVETGTWTTSAWAGDTGGLLAFAAKGTLTITGTITANGVSGSVSTSNPAGGAGIGFRGGQGVDGSTTVTSFQGEGSAGAGGQSTSANGSGGGGAQLTASPGGQPGGGGGHAASGTSGSGGTGTGTPGTGGSATGSADLITLTFGGGGGGGTRESDNETGSGAGGAGIVVAFAKTIATITGGITLNGGVGGNASGNPADGASGAGGSFLAVCETGAFGTNKATATGGATSGNAGAGSVGRIAIHHSGTVTGTTNPTFTDVEDLTLKESTGAFLSLI